MPLPAVANRGVHVVGGTGNILAYFFVLNEAIGGKLVWEKRVLGRILPAPLILGRFSETCPVVVELDADDNDDANYLLP